MRRAEGARERLDGPVAPADLAGSLRDVERLSGWFGGYALSLRAVRRLAARLPAGRPLRIADVGGGAGGFAVRLARWGRREGRPLRVIVVDHAAATLALARAAARGHPEILLVQASATALPFREGALDVATSALTLHHLEPDGAVRALEEMRAAARALVLNDLLRTRLSWALVWLATRLVARHPFSRHDGPLSVRRAYTPGELRGMAEKAALPGLRIRRHPFLGRLLATTP